MGSAHSSRVTARTTRAKTPGEQLTEEQLTEERLKETLVFIKKNPLKFPMLRRYIGGEIGVKFTVLLVEISKIKRLQESGQIP